MHIDFNFLNDDQKLDIARALSIIHEDSNYVRIQVSSKNSECLLIAARVHCLSKDEIYFLQSIDDLRKPLNHRNEAAAISLLLQRLAAAKDMDGKDNDDDDPMMTIQEYKTLLSSHSQSLWPKFASTTEKLSNTHQTPPHGNCPTTTPPLLESSTPAATEFLNWSKDQGIKLKITLATFGELRGCAATADILPGDNILSIPMAALMYDDTVNETDLGRMLSAIPDIAGTDNLLIIFTMCDRFDPESRWASFWNLLPQDGYYTGLSFPSTVTSLIRGTAAHLEIVRGQVHLRKQYQATKPILDLLLQAYPQYLQPSWFDYDHYVWAAELWYSYSFEIEFPPNPKSKTVMVPFACLVNHSPWPTVVRYGRTNPVTNTLDFPAFRPCTKGQQVYISYGPVPNMKLLCYYGFVIENNPHDVVPLLMEPPTSEDDGSRKEQISTAMAMFGIEMEHSLRNGPIATKLLGCMRLLVATSEELSTVTSGRINPLRQPLSAACELQALDTLKVSIESLMEPIREDLIQIATSQQETTEVLMTHGKSTKKLNENGFDTDWRASIEFCRIYLEDQKTILERSLAEIEKLKERVQE